MAEQGEGEQDRVFLARRARLKTGMAGRKRHRFSAFWLRYKKNIRSPYRLVIVVQKSRGCSRGSWSRGLVLLVRGCSLVLLLSWSSGRDVVWSWSFLGVLVGWCWSSSRVVVLGRVRGSCLVVCSWIVVIWCCFSWLCPFEGPFRG